jgi:DNA-binding HxlR family transcriptional regulator
MQRSSFREMNCSIGQSLEVIGEWWSLLIIRDAFLGVTRFDDFSERLGIARNVLNQRLSHLVDEGVFERVAYNDHPPRYDYVLTEQGRDLWPVVVALRQWGDRWRAPDGPPLQLVHRECGHIRTVPVCAHWHEWATDGAGAGGRPARRSNGRPLTALGRLRRPSMRTQCWTFHESTKACAASK